MNISNNEESRRKAQPQETERQSGKKGRFNRNLCYVEIYLATQNTGDHFKKNIDFPEGNKLFAGGFCANLDETNAGKDKLQRDGTGNGLPNITNTSAESLQLQMSVLRQNMSIFQSSRQVSQVQVMAGQNVAKDKVLDVSDPSQNV